VAAAASDSAQQASAISQAKDYIKQNLARGLNVWWTGNTVGAFGRGTIRIRCDYNR
jgi:hypothetical protein